MRAERSALRTARMLVACAASCGLLACSPGGPDAATGQLDAAVRADSDAAISGYDSAVATGSTDASIGAHSDAAAALDAAGGAVDTDAATTADAALALDAGPLPTLEALPYARGVVSFSAGANAGFGDAKYPDNVLGPPTGLGTSGGSLDVLSLGKGGSIVLDFGERDIVDAPGADFIVFENPFWPGGDATLVYADPAEVAVSDDGTTWHAFPCDADGDGHGVFAGCAGWTPTEKYDAFRVLPLDPEVTGGDAFDLEDLGLTRVRYVRIHDLATEASGNAAGFDLDAVGIVHFEEQ